MVASARVAHLSRRAATYGVNTGPISVDMDVVRERKRNIVNSFRSSGEQRLANEALVDLIYGEASFTGPHTIEVRTNTGQVQQISSEKIFINTGGRASRLPLEGLDTITALDSTSIMELDEVPEHLMVLGGGYIGLEFGQMFHRFGSRVTVIQRSEKLLGREDDDVSAEIAKILAEDGLEFLMGATTLKVERLDDGKIALHLKTAAGTQTLVGSHLLLSSGRVPNTEKLNLAAAGVQVDKGGFIVANDKLETNVAGIWALGDVKGGPAFTHISYDDFRVIRDNLLENRNVTIADRLLPYTLFTDPQLGRIGLSEADAKAKGLNIKIAKVPMNYIARALEMDESRGFIKAIVDAETEQILGAAVLGIEGGELMATLQVAIMAKLPYTVLRDGVFAHPTLAESLNTLFSQFQ
jgi:pyruvate/2-oxoglutarate dehydrogenase complex dihydrolipoamide dehydrogenase (E3) component